MLHITFEFPGTFYSVQIVTLHCIKLCLGNSTCQQYYYSIKKTFTVHNDDFIICGQRIFTFCTCFNWYVPFTGFTIRIGHMMLLCITNRTQWHSLVLTKTSSFEIRIFFSQIFIFSVTLSLVQCTVTRKGMECA